MKQLQDNVEIEYELTFLAKSLPDGISELKPVKMKDIYVPEGVDHPQLRLRQKNDKYEITKKIPVDDSDASIQSETTIQLNQQEFEALAKCSGLVVEKDRYKVRLAGHDAEVDVFTGALSGLVLIDFEFESQEEMQDFKPPDVCANDVTQESFIAGGLLAGRKYSDIEDQLIKFGYKKLTI